jgi:hypothetical protein
MRSPSVIARMTETPSPSQLHRITSSLTCVLLVFLLIMHQLHAISVTRERLAPPSGRRTSITRRAKSTTSSSMGRSQHTAPPINAIINNEKVIILREEVLVYAVQSSLLGCAAEPVAGRDEARILCTLVRGSVGVLSTHRLVSQIAISSSQLTNRRFQGSRKYQEIT